MKLRQIEMFILGFIIFISETTLAMAISEQTSPAQEEQEYNTLEDIKNEIENISSRKFWGICHLIAISILIMKI